MKLIKVVKKDKPIKKITESQYMTSDRMNDEKKIHMVDPINL